MKVRGQGYRIVRALIRSIVRPRIAGAPPGELPAQPVFVLPQRSLSDLVVLDLVCAREQWPDPRSGVRLGKGEEERRVVFLNRPAGPLQRNTMRAVPERLVRLLENPQAPSSDITFLPVQVFWGRTTSRERSFVGTLFSEHWAATSRLRRLVNLLISRKHIVVDFGEALSLRDAMQGDERRRARRTARILRVRLRQQKVAALGPDFSHRRTLLGQVVESRAVLEAIEQRVQVNGSRQDPEKLRRRLRRQAVRAAMNMASDMSYPTVMTLLRLLTAFWRRIYDRIDVHGLERIVSLGRTHTLVYLPSHRSHVDYLLLSYLLFQRGLMIPHIAAGENMNLPFVGNLLRRGGAFYMQRSFRGDPVHAALFSEYLYQVYRRGHCVEFFPEGTRTRTGRLLPARIGLLKMTVAHARRGLPRPLAFVPVYFGYEKLIESASYLDEMRGAEKKRESVADILRSLRLIRQDFGCVEVNFGKPLRLGDWLEKRAGAVAPARAEASAEVDAAVAVAGEAGDTEAVQASEAGDPAAVEASEAIDWAAAHTGESDDPAAVKASEAGDLTAAHAGEAGDPAAAEATALGREILMRINDAASINPVNLAALVILCTPRLAIAESTLANQIDCYLDLLRRDSANHDFQLTAMDGAGAIDHIARLGMLNREKLDSGEVLALPPAAAVQMTWYRNNVAHALALPSLIACLLEKRRRPLASESLERMVQTVYPYLARELHGRFEPGDTARWAEHLLGAGLIRADGDRFAPPPAQSRLHYSLHLLAGIARPILERNYIVLGLLAAPGKPPGTRAELLERSQRIARKAARIHGINAPEFFDSRLFDAFVDKLIEDGAVIENASGGLTRTAIVDDVLRGSETVIDAEYRYAILSE